MPELFDVDDPWRVAVTGPTPPDPTPTPTPRKRLAGTPQQEAFWDALVDTADPLACMARAGAGKSTSAREGMARMLGRDEHLRIRYSCFNRAIADEFAAKCPAGVEVGTMHRFGLQALGRGGSKVEKNKTYLILDSLPRGGSLPRFVRKAVSQLVSCAKNRAIEPSAHGDRELGELLEGLLDDYDVETYGRVDDVVDFAVDALRRSAELTSLVDFDDMLWLPVLHDLRFPAVDALFIDEAQDLNPVQHELAARLCRSGRLILIGDPFQAIYGFRGADSRSIDTLSERAGARAMPLTVSFRCPAAHAELARRIVPDFEAHPDAPAGTVESCAPAELPSRLRPGDLVLCRSNAPLLSLCLKAIAGRVPPTMRGRAIGDSLTTILRKVGADRIGTTAQLGREVERWRAREVERLSARDGTEDLVEQANDRAACLQAIAETCASPAEIPGVIVALFDDVDKDGRVTFSSVHRAKGSEARRVHYLRVPYSEPRDRDRPVPAWVAQQRRNLEYVALTRSLDHLTLA